MVPMLLFKGLVSAEGDSHKHQVYVFYNGLLSNIIILHVAKDFGQFPLRYVGSNDSQSDRIQHSDHNKYAN